MIYDSVICSNQISLRILLPSDVSEEYVSWLNDPEINRYLECRHMIHTVESQRKYIEDMRKSDYDYFFGVFHEDKHIGSVRLGPISSIYRHCGVGILISKEYWGNNTVFIVWMLAEDFAFNYLKLHKIYGNVYSSNKASIKVLERMGWDMIGLQKDHFIDFDGNFADGCIFEKINPNDLS